MHVELDTCVPFHTHSVDFKCKQSAAKGRQECECALVLFDNTLQMLGRFNRLLESLPLQL